MRIQPWATQMGVAQVMWPNSLRVKVGLASGPMFPLWLAVLCCPSESWGLLIQRRIEVRSGSFLSLGEVGKGLTRDVKPREKIAYHTERLRLACPGWLGAPERLMEHLAVGLGSPLLPLSQG